MACSHTQRFTGAHHMMCLMSSQAELVDHCNVYRWLHDFVRAGHAPLHAQERCICIEFRCKCGLKCQSLQDSSVLVMQSPHHQLVGFRNFHAYC